MSTRDNRGRFASGGNKQMAAVKRTPRTKSQAYSIKLPDGSTKSVKAPAGVKIQVGKRGGTFYMSPRSGKAVYTH